MKKQKIAIIGYGRFGSLLAEILKPFGELHVISDRKIKQAGIKQIDYPGLKEIDWVIPAVPISALEATLKKIKPFLKKGSLVMDVCSVKVYPCRWLKKHLSKDVELLGTHPMFGPDSAKNGLDGLQIVVCPLRISEKRLVDVLAIFKKLKLKIIETTPENHDKQGAFNLSLVHFLGRALPGSGVKTQSIVTKGYERLLEVSNNVNNDTWQLFFDMQKFNPYSQSLRSKFIKELNRIEDKIKKDTITKKQ